MKTFKVSNLYHEFIKDTSLDGQVSANEAALCLAQKGFIDLLPDRFKAEKPLDFYQWVKTEKIPRTDFKQIIFKALCEVKKEK